MTSFSCSGPASVAKQGRKNPQNLLCVAQQIHNNVKILVNPSSHRLQVLNDINELLNPVRHRVSSPIDENRGESTDILWLRSQPMNKYPPNYHNISPALSSKMRFSQNVNKVFTEIALRAASLKMDETELGTHHNVIVG